MSAERRGALAGPESAAEHVRNALQLLNDLKTACGEEYPDLRWFKVRDIEQAVRGRLAKALFILDLYESSSVAQSQPPRGAADATGTP